jgi:quercetin dioxygenase-like cupin family protein/pimeloyl-ACP methyl ester carboxylesterase
MKTKRIVAAAVLTIVGSGLAPQVARAQQPGIRRTELQRHDLGVPGREVVQVRVELDPGVAVGKHTHPGEELVYVLEGSLEYQVEGKRPVTLEAGGTLFIPAGTIHAAKNVGSVNGTELATYVVEKGKPLAIMLAKETAVTTTTTTASRDAAKTTATDAIRPFHLSVPEEALAELRRRIVATNWPEKETVDDQSQGVPLAMIQELARYWATDYDWRKCEAKLNALPQFITTIDGLDIHFIHVRSKHKNALPLIVNHGWPGSIIEQLKIIGPLTDPTAYGGRAEDAFDVVIPSMPGYGFSGKPASTGWGPERMGRAWAELMKRLGYTRYVAQGGDWGAFVVDQMGLQAPAGLLAIHTNMPATVPADVDRALLAGDPPPAGLSADEKRAYQQLVRTFKQVEYARMMATRPQTLYGIADSPVGLAAWLLDHNDADGQPAAAVASALNRTTSATGELTRDEILDNITLYWLTNTGVSASRLYWEYKGGFFNAKGVSIPVAVSVFPGEQYEAPRSWAERAYPNLIHYNKVDKGGHFAAWEQPRVFSEEVRAAFRSLR